MKGEEGIYQNNFPFVCRCVTRFQTSESVLIKVGEIIANFMKRISLYFLKVVWFMVVEL